MNKLSIRTIITAVAVFTLSIHAAPPLFSGGSGTASSPYLITGYADLEKLASLVNAPATNAAFADRHYKLLSDIDLSGYDNWIPVGVGLIRSEGRDDRLTFRGIFDGNGKKIINMKITGAERAPESFQGQGLFGVIDGGMVKDVGLDGVSINIKAGRVGGVAGAAVAGGVIENCYVLGSVSGAGSVGGIVGHIDDSVVINNSYVIGEVSGKDRVGGVAGYTYNSAITGSYAIGKVSEDGTAVDAAAGHIWNSAITKSDVFDPKADAEEMLAVVPENLLSRVSADAKDAKPIVAVVKESAGKITVGPNPVNRLSGTVNFFRNGRQIKKSTLTVYYSNGRVAQKISLSEKSASSDGWRQVGSWDLRDKKGQIVSEGTYAVKGTVIATNGKKEKVSLVLGVW